MEPVAGRGQSGFRFRFRFPFSFSREKTVSCFCQVVALGALGWMLPGKILREGSAAPWDTPCQALALLPYGSEGDNCTHWAPGARQLCVRLSHKRTRQKAGFLAANPQLGEMKAERWW